MGDVATVGKHRVHSPNQVVRASQLIRGGALCLENQPLPIPVAGDAPDDVDVSVGPLVCVWLNNIRRYLNEIITTTLSPLRLPRLPKPRIGEFKWLQS